MSEFLQDFIVYVYTDRLSVGKIEPKIFLWHGNESVCTWLRVNIKCRPGY